MNCDALHRRLLGLECPDQPPADARRHLAECPTCRAWHRGLLRVERAAANLPAPAPVRKNAFLEGLRNGEIPVTPEPIILSLPVRPADPVKDKKERGRRKMAFAIAMAAGLLVVALGAWLLNVGGPNPRHPAHESLVAKCLKQEPRWAHARTATDRLLVLSDLADEAQFKAHALAESGTREDLANQVKLYRQMIEIVTHEAPHVDPADRASVLAPIAERLARAESDAERLAARLNGHQAVSLRELAAAARDADRELRRLL